MRQLTMSQAYLGRTKAFLLVARGKLPRLSTFFSLLLVSIFLLFAQTLFATEIIEPRSGLLSAKTTDLEIPAGPVTLSIERLLTRSDRGDGLLGREWRLNWESALSRSGDTTSIQDPGGEIDFALEAGKGVFRGGYGERISVEKDGRALRTKIDGTVLTYDKNGRLSGLEYPSGAKVTLSYSPTGKLSRIDGPKGVFLKFTFENQTGRLSLVEASTGAALRYSYVDGQLDAVQLNGAPPLRYSYVPNGVIGVLARVDDPRSGVTAFTYDVRGRVTKRQWADGSADTYEYDDAANSIRRTSPMGGVTLTKWSLNGRSEETTDPLGNKTTTDYDGSFRPVLVTGPAGVISRFAYDTLGRLILTESCCAEETRIDYVGDTSRIQSITYPDGARQEFDYDPKGNLLSFKDRDRIMVSRTYLPDGMVKTVKGADGSVREYKYNPEGRIESQTDEVGKTTKFEYDKRGNLVRVNKAGGDVSEYAYDAQDRLISIKDPSVGTAGYEYDKRSGHITRSVTEGEGASSYTYDARGRMTSETRPSGATTQYTYNAAGFLETLKDATGNTTGYEYDLAGNLVKEVNALGGVTKRTYDRAGRILSRTDPNGGSVSFEYDKGGKLVKMIQPDGQSETYGYDGSGHLVQVAHSSGAVWNYAYDAGGRVAEVTGPLGYSLSTKYDADGRIVEITDSLGRKTGYTYDQTGRLSGVKDPSGAIARLEYNDRTQDVVLIDPLGRKTIVKSDGAGRLGALTRGNEQLLKLEYEKGRLARVLGPAGSSVSYSYDKFGREEGSTYADGEKLHFRYNLGGQIVEAADALGKTWTMSYAPLGVLGAISAPDSSRYAYTYTQGGNVETITDAMGRSRRFDYDSSGRRTRETDALGRQTERSYQTGALVRSVKTPDGKSMQMGYDLLGRLSQVKYPDGVQIKYLYDLANNLVHEEMENYRADYSYDINDKMVEARYQPANLSVQYRYDSAGRRTSLEVKGVGQWSYKYDEKDQLAELRDPAGKTTRFEYDDAGRVTRRILPNGITLERSYNTRGRPVGFAARDASNKTIVDRKYEYDLSGNLVKEFRENGAQITYRYDDKDQLIALEGPGNSQRVDYDAVGNITMYGDAAEYDAADQIKRFGKDAFTYDDRGRMASQESENGKIEYVYRTDGLLAAVKRDGKPLAEYGYDAKGLRIWKKIEGKKSYYIYDGYTLLLELDESLKVTRTWAPGPELDRPVALIQGAKSVYPLSDPFSSVIAATDEKGALIGRLEYKAFGELSTGDDKKLLSEVLQHGFSGRQFDPETGLYYFRARYYHPGLGRFLTPDPVAGRLTIPPSLHPYQYAYNNPLRYQDNMGTNASDLANAVIDKMPVGSDIANKADNVSGAVGSTWGYGAGYLSGYVVSSPLRGYYWATGNTQQTQRLNQALDTLSTNVTGMAGNKVTVLTTSLATDRLRFGEASGNQWAGNVDQGKPVSALQTGLTVVSEVARGVGVLQTPGDAIRAGTKAIEVYGQTRVAANLTAAEKSFFLQNPNVGGVTDAAGRITLNPFSPVGPDVIAHEGVHALSTLLGLDKPGGLIGIYNRLASPGSVVTEEGIAYVVQSLHRTSRGMFGQGPDAASTIIDHILTGYFTNPAEVTALTNYLATKGFSNPAALVNFLQNLENKVGSTLGTVYRGAASLPTVPVKPITDLTKGAGTKDPTADRLKELERMAGLEKAKIESTLGAIITPLTNSCGRLASIASEAGKQGTDAQTALAELPAAGAIAAVQGAAKKCQVASGIRAKLEAMSKDAQGKVDRLTAAFEGLDGLAQSCSSLSEAKMVRGGFKGSAATINQINGAVGKAQALSEELNRIKSEAQGVTGTVSLAQAVRDKLNGIEASAQATISTYDAQTKLVSEYNDKLKAAADQLLVSIGNLEGAFADVPEATRKAKMDELRNLVSALRGRACNTEGKRPQLKAGVAMATNARTTAVSRVASLEAQLGALASCQGISVDDLVAAIGSAQGAAGTLLVVHSDLPDKAAECEQKYAKTSTNTKTTTDSGDNGGNRHVGKKKPKSTGQSSVDQGNSTKPDDDGSDLAGRYSNSESNRTKAVQGRADSSPPPGYFGGGGPSIPDLPNFGKSSRPSSGCRSDSECSKGYCCRGGKCIPDSQMGH